MYVAGTSAGRLCFTLVIKMQLSHAFLVFLLCSLGCCMGSESLLVSETENDCPCSDPQLCNVITTPPRKEVFAFWVGGANWMKYDWTKLTTVVMFGHYDAQLMCYAHSKGVRVTLLGEFPMANLSSVADRSAWVINMVDKAVQNHMDGINLDIEFPLEAASAKYLTALVAETTKTFHLSIPGSQVTFDVAWSSACIDLRCYDYKGIADSCDFLFVMSYDEQSQIHGPCIAMANSPYNKTASGVEAYLKLGIPPNQLVLGVPWYGYDYPCLSVSKTNVCSIKHVPFRGVPCSDAAGRQRSYKDVTALLKNNATTGRLYNTTYQAPFFNYQNTISNQTHQVWYDDPQSLTARYKYAKTMDLRGVGMWNADSLDYSDDPEAKKLTKAMWDAIEKYFLQDSKEGPQSHANSQI